MENPIYHEHPVNGIDYPRNLKKSFQMKPPVDGGKGTELVYSGDTGDKRDKGTG
jgi:hypothetical protein